MAQLNFDANQVAPDTGGGDPIPEGWYNVMIDESDIKPTKDSATTGGAFLQVRFSVIDGQFQNRKLFSRFNIRNQNPTAQEIGYKQLSAVAHAVGVLMVQDSQQLHGIPLKVKVKIRQGSPKMVNNQPTGEMYDPSNEISSYKNINEVTAPPAAPAAGAPAGFGGFVPPPAAAPNPAQWAQPQASAFTAPAAPIQQFTPQAAAPQQFAPPPQQFAPPVQQFAQPPAQAPAQQFAAPAQQFAPQPWAQPAAQPPAPQQFAQPPAQAAAPAWQPPAQQAPAAQQFAPPSFAAPQQAPAPTAQPAAVQAAAGSAPPWARQPG